MTRGLGQTYQLKIPGDGDKLPCAFEFTAAGPEAALRLAFQFSDGRPAELYENERKLAVLHLDDDHGFWIIE